MITGLEHVAIYTKNMEATRHFYVDQLGFEASWEGKVLTRNGETHACTVQCGDCILELVCPPVLDNVHTEAGPVQHIALHVENLERTIRWLQEQGIEIREEPEWISYEGGIIHAFIYGPSNERIELVERRPKD